MWLMCINPRLDNSTFHLPTQLPTSSSFFFPLEQNISNSIALDWSNSYACAFYLPSIFLSKSYDLCCFWRNTFFSHKFLCDSPYTSLNFFFFPFEISLELALKKKSAWFFHRLRKIRFHWASNISAYINLCRFLLFYSFGILEMIYGDFFNLSVYSATYDHWFIIDTTHTEANNKNTVTLNISSLNY